MQKHFDPRRNGAGFMEYKTYRIQLLVPQPVTPQIQAALKNSEVAETVAR
jgi:hypothetical protein